MERQETQNKQLNIEGKNKVRELTLLDFKIYYEDTVIKVV